MSDEVALTRDDLLDRALASLVEGDRLVTAGVGSSYDYMHACGRKAMACAALAHEYIDLARMVAQ